MESLPTNQLSQRYLPQVTTHLIIRLPAAELTEVIKYVNTKTLKYLCGQHEPDDEDKLIHCHFMLCDLQISNEALRKTLVKHDISGAKYSWLMTRIKNKGLYDYNHLGTYIMKGGKTTVYHTSFDDEKIKEFIESWQIPHAILLKNKEYDEVKDVKKNENEILTAKFMEEYDTTQRPCLDRVRTWTMRYYWRRDGWMPHATVYKRSAASLYMKHIEKFSKMDESFIGNGLENLKQLWY